LAPANDAAAGNPICIRSRMHSFAKLVNAMLKQGSAGTAVGDRPITRDDQIAFKPAVLLDPNQAFARRAANQSVPRQKAKRKQAVRDPRHSVLIVDDVPDVTEMIGLFLKHAGYEVVTADSAQAALRIAKEQVFDVIISDIGMPEMNGYELAESLRTRAEYQGIPIIAVTGYSEYDDRSRALQSGFNAHLTKPIDPSELLRLMTELLG